MVIATSLHRLVESDSLLIEQILVISNCPHRRIKGHFVAIFLNAFLQVFDRLSVNVECIKFCYLPKKFTVISNYKFMQ